MTIEDDPLDTLHGDFFAVIPESVLYAKIGPNAVRLYGVLQRHIGDNKFAWPSRSTLAKKMHVSTGTVDKAIVELVKLGVLTVKARVNDAGDRTSSAYYLHGGVVQKLSNPPTQKLSNPSAKTEHEREPLKESQELHSPLMPVNEYPERFELLWNIYPRRESKKAAWRKVQALIRKNVRYEELVNATQNYAATCIGKEQKHIKLPSTFFGPDDHWREWLTPGFSLGAPIVPVHEDFELVIERRREESVPPPQGFAASVREQIMKGNPDV